MTRDHNDDEVDDRDTLLFRNSHVEHDVTSCYDAVSIAAATTASMSAHPTRNFCAPSAVTSRVPRHRIHDEYRR